MSAYADTNFLTSLYLPRVHSLEAQRLLADFLRKQDEALPFTPLHRLEFRNAIRLAVFRQAEPGELSLDRTAARRVLAEHEADLSERVFIEHTPIDWTEALRQAEVLSKANTEEKGFRSLDLLHVGAALSLGAKEFFTFDRGAGQLAKLAGLTVRPALR
ncbi:MAG: PIN domain-containing protein [Verrucomicrobia bacterium]|nr:PIN domain-containing protein [Verrucomicrobiota bacterium]